MVHDVWSKSSETVPIANERYVAESCTCSRSEQKLSWNGILHDIVLYTSGPVLRRVFVTTCTCVNWKQLLSCHIVVSWENVYCKGHKDTHTHTHTWWRALRWYQWWCCWDHWEVLRWGRGLAAAALNAPPSWSAADFAKWFLRASHTCVHTNIHTGIQNPINWLDSWFDFREGACRKAQKSLKYAKI